MAPVLYGSPFDLHPPAAFGLYAGGDPVFGLHGSVEATLFSAPQRAVVLGTVTCVLTFLIVERWRRGWPPRRAPAYWSHWIRW